MVTANFPKNVSVNGIEMFKLERWVDRAAFQALCVYKQKVHSTGRPLKEIKKGTNAIEQYHW